MAVVRALEVVAHVFGLVADEQRFLLLGPNIRNPLQKKRLKAGEKCGRHHLVAIERGSPLHGTLNTAREQFLILAPDY